MFEPRRGPRGPIILTGDVATSAGQTGETFTGSLDYNNLTDTLTLQFTNTSPASFGGNLTGFVFAVSGSDHAVLFSTTNANFLNLATSNHAIALNSAPFRGMSCRILKLDPLIRAKRAAGRDKDLVALPELEALLKTRLKH